MHITQNKLVFKTKKIEFVTIKIILKFYTEFYVFIKYYLLYNFYYDDTQN